MPCNAVRTMTLEITASDHAILTEAVRRCGVHGSADPADVARRIIASGRVTVQATSLGREAARSLRRYYAEGVVEEAARRNGWRVEREETRDGRTVLEVTRR